MKAEKNWIPWGTLGRAHGLQGELRISLHNPDSEHLALVKEVRIDGGEQPLQTRLQSLRGSGSTRIARFEGVNNRNQAEPLTGAVVRVPADLFPTLGEGEFYAFELEGLQAIRADGQRVGVVETLSSFGAGDILVVRIGGDVEFFPFAEPYVGAVDLEAGTVVVDLDALQE